MEKRSMKNIDMEESIQGKQKHKQSKAQEKANIPRLIGAAAEGDVSILVELLGEDPFMLDDIDSIPFVTTPLHIAASLGKTHFSLEMLMLKPSFGVKLDPTWFSPLHLAVTNGHAETVRRLMAMDKELVRLKGKDGLTPLHYAILVGGRSKILDEMLTACPESIEDLTNWGDTALHLAVKRNKFKSFAILVGHTFLLHCRDIFRRKDDDGFTVLHHLILGTKLKMIRLLFSYYPDGGGTVGINVTDGKYQTAWDILEELRRTETNNVIIITKIGAILSRNGALRAKNSHFLLWMNYYINSVITCPYKYSTMRIDGDARNAMLVVAALINTIAFQVGVNPPGGFWQDTITRSGTSASDKSYQKPHLAGTSVLAINNPIYFQLIIFFNMLAFVSSLFMIISLTRVLRMRVNIITSLFSMTITYLFSIMSVSSFKVSSPSSTVSVSRRVIAVTTIAGIGLVCLFVEPVLTKLRLKHRSKLLRQRLAAKDDYDSDSDHDTAEMDGHRGMALSMLLTRLIFRSLK